MVATYSWAFTQTAVLHLALASHQSWALLEGKVISSSVPLSLAIPDKKLILDLEKYPSSASPCKAAGRAPWNGQVILQTRALLPFRERCMAAVKGQPSVLNCWEFLRWQAKVSDQQVKYCQMLLCLSDLFWGCQSRPVTQARLHRQSHKQRSARNCRGNE